MIITKVQIIKLLNECTTVASSSAPMSFVGSKPFPIQEDMKEFKPSKMDFKQRLKNLKQRRTGIIKN